jgi:ornithine cyclodeaminase/alanine dehydrogenase-like protein (mu-crystallin family)
VRRGGCGDERLAARLRRELARGRPARERGHIRAGLGEVVAGLEPGRGSDQEITLFKSVGLALQDAAVASVVYRKALEARVGTEFTF